MESRQSKSFVVEIENGSNNGSLRNLTLDSGIYTKMQVINRYNNNLNIPVEIRIVSRNQDILETVDVRAIEPSGGGLDFYDAKAPIEINGNNSIDIYITTAKNVVATADEPSNYYVVFWKDPKSC
jgi:hypothetical protein